MCDCHVDTRTLCGLFDGSGVSRDEARLPQPHVSRNNCRCFSPCSVGAMRIGCCGQWDSKHAQSWQNADFLLHLMVRTVPSVIELEHKVTAQEVASGEKIRGPVRIATTIDHAPERVTCGVVPSTSWFWVMRMVRTLGSHLLTWRVMSLVTNAIRR